MVFRVPVIASSCLALSASGCAESGMRRSTTGFDAQTCVEQALRRNPDPETLETARVTFETECGKGVPAACSMLGVMNEIGVGLPVNPRRAIALYDLACRTGNEQACTNQAVAQVEGIGGPREVLLGARVLEPACDHGDARACLHLARLHEDGQVPSRDPALTAR